MILFAQHFGSGRHSMNLSLSGRNEFRGYFSSGKADDAGGMTSGKEDSAVSRKIDRISSTD